LKKPVEVLVVNDITHISQDFSKFSGIASGSKRPWDSIRFTYRNFGIVDVVLTPQTLREISTGPIDTAFSFSSLYVGSFELQKFLATISTVVEILASVVGALPTETEEIAQSEG